MKCNHVTLAWISGLVWIAVGFFLLTFGLSLLTLPLTADAVNTPLLDLVAPYFGGNEQAIVVLVAIALYIGFLKGKHVLGKSARKGVERLKILPNPVSIAKIYSAKYYILLGGMVGLGMSIKYFGIPTDVRGFIDVAIGSALIQGGVIYFRLAHTLKPQTN